MGKGGGEGLKNLSLITCRQPHSFSINLTASRQPQRSLTGHAYLSVRDVGHQYKTSLISHLIYTLTERVVGAPQMIRNLFTPFSSVLHCPLGLGESGPVHSLCCLPASSSVCFVFFPLSLCHARWFWPDLMNARPYHCSLRLFTMVRRSSWGPIACWIGTDFLVGNMVFV